ncbi:hypothetical protein [Maricaulis sp.]|uniref:hypothetical protein n=1 Tax=Maricaulis sp. TaxID=1486257 RepID=UPI00262DD3D0|nr:hypothetical protein [Maricaulis sp.]
MRFRFVAIALIASFASACATSTPVCRAPSQAEMQAFMAVISHNPAALSEAMASGAARDALNAQDANIRSHIWGSQGETRGTVLGLLSRPPLCVLDNQAANDMNGGHNILVYPQSSYDAVLPAADTGAAFPYGVRMRDYLTCRFTETANGLRLADACGFRPYTAPPVTG